MSEDEKTVKAEGEPDLGGYKEEILPVNKGRVTLQRDLYFTATTQRGYEVEYDVRYEEGCSPTETLLLSLAGCLSIDIVHVLRKMRCHIARYEMTVEGTRNLAPPQSYRRFAMVAHISGEGVTPPKIERAISLSREKYCSVYHTLRPDIQIDIEYRIE